MELTKEQVKRIAERKAAAFLKLEDTRRMQACRHTLFGLVARVCKEEWSSSISAGTKELRSAPVMANNLKHETQKGATMEGSPENFDSFSDSGDAVLLAAFSGFQELRFEDVIGESVRLHANGDEGIGDSFSDSMLLACKLMEEKVTPDVIELDGEDSTDGAIVKKRKRSVRPQHPIRRSERTKFPRKL